MKNLLLNSIVFTGIITLASACTAGKEIFDPKKTYPKRVLQSDYKLFRNILEDAHPSLYWYTPKDSMDYYFNLGYNNIKEEMTEPAFKNLLSYIITKINCGHTTVKYSKKYSKYLDTVKATSFPLQLKVWDDSSVVYFNLNRSDSLLQRGAVLKALDNIPIQKITDSLSHYLSTDGYSVNHKYQQLSNGFGFGALYKTIFNPKNNIVINYIDSYGNERKSNTTLYDPRKDTLLRRFNSLKASLKINRKQFRQNKISSARSVQIDTALQSAVLTVNTFGGGYHLRSFFKKTFHALSNNNIQHLVIDLRFNGGGNVGNSNLLTRYLVQKPFKAADSLYSIRKLSKYEKHIQNTFFAAFFMNFMTKKKRDGNYHFGYFERHYFKPVRKNHFNGNVYILSGGNTFSAATLFMSAVKGQSNITIVGEESGGGAYGNTAWFIPDATLPNTRIRFRLPRFRMVINKNSPKNGRGVLPDVEVKPGLQYIKKGVDAKMEYVKKQIIAANKHKMP
jgi:hypothetical protein